MKDGNYLQATVCKNALRHLHRKPDAGVFPSVPTHLRAWEAATEDEDSSQRGSFAESLHADFKTVSRIPFSSSKNAWNSVAFIQHKDLQLSFD